VRLPKAFGVGPFGIVGSAALLAVAFWLEPYIPLQPLFPSSTIPRACFVVAAILSIMTVVWSVRSLPVSMRGRGVCMRGAYRHVRHPVYAAFTTIGALGLALYLNHPVFLLWLLAVQVWWHWLIPFEERTMVEEFGDEYERYMAQTGRFVPRFWQSRTRPGG
jgi:protein-S-isoprenylcysteine O-methyltransferase Ste14